jgi:hypothetical protein
MLFPLLTCAHIPPFTHAAACEVLSALMGPDQPTEVARQALLAVRRLAEALRAHQREAGTKEDPLQPYLATLLPPMCSVAAHTSGEGELLMCAWVLELGV